MTPELAEAIRAKNHDVQTFLFAYYVQKLAMLYPHHVLAIMAYGSALNDVTKSVTSTPDFYLVVDDYKKFYKKKRERFLNRNLPPNIYHLNTAQGSCKYCVISMGHLRREVGDKAKDVWHLGRFSKRMGLLWTISPSVDDEMAQIQAMAVISIAKKVLQSAEGSFSLDQWIEKCLYLSYLGDVRIESSDKVCKIMFSEKVYYQKIFSLALQELGLSVDDAGQYTVKKTEREKNRDHRRFEKFIRRSRIRARMRWPKNMFTVSNWLDYILAKIERTQNIQLNLTPTEKKFWYIFGWKYFLRLYRKKLIK